MMTFDDLVLIIQCSAAPAQDQPGPTQLRASTADLRTADSIVCGIVTKYWKRGRKKRKERWGAATLITDIVHTFCTYVSSYSTV